MKKARSLWSNFKAGFAKIHLVDRFLIIFMIILLLQSSYILFVFESASAEGNSIDIIIRTSTAAIFGYFLSTNFIRHSSSPPTDPISAIGKDSLPANGAGGISNRMGFAYPGSDSDSGSGSDSDSDKVLTPGSTSGEGQKENSPEKNDISNRLQIIVAAGIGLFCLIVLILIRNIIGAGANLSSSASSTSTVAQFRDIVSGCIGFLIGCPSSTSGGGNKIP